ncbi:FCS-Like Zinc finger 8-like [Nymphaea colorata]|nr:FCS-Like Zinc finger 8-like [Nymphaea colorata]
MLRKRSRGVGTKATVVCENAYSGTLLSNRLFIGFSTKGIHEGESIMSPTSILDSKPFSGFGNYFWSDKRSKSPDSVSECKHHPWVGLGLVDALDNGNGVENGLCKPENKMVLFGSQLRIQIPPRTESPVPALVPVNFGLPEPFTGRLTPREMELSEDYTCVITHGPNPRTTHIYGDRIVESSSAEFPASRKESPAFNSRRAAFPLDDFLSFCHFCKKKLGEKDDIFMYRGEKAFCSSECRDQEILFDERMEKLTSNSFESPAQAHCREIFEADC